MVTIKPTDGDLTVFGVFFSVFKVVLGCTRALLYLEAALLLEELAEHLHDVAHDVAVVVAEHALQRLHPVRVRDLGSERGTAVVCCAPFIGCDCIYSMYTIYRRCETDA